MEKRRDPFKKGSFCAGFNKTVKQIEKGCALMVYVASDCDGVFRERLSGLCNSHDVPFEDRVTKSELGRLCGIEVDCCAAAILKT